VRHASNSAKAVHVVRNGLTAMIVRTIIGPQIAAHAVTTAKNKTMYPQVLISPYCRRPSPFRRTTVTRIWNSQHANHAPAALSQLVMMKLQRRNNQSFCRL
jgi:hypothetical protein